MLYTLLFSASFGVTRVLFAFSSSPPYPTLYFFLYLFKLYVTSYLLFVCLFEFDTGPHTSQASLKLIHCITEDDLGFMVLLPKCEMIEVSNNAWFMWCWRLTPGIHVCETLYELSYSLERTAFRNPVGFRPYYSRGNILHAKYNITSITWRHYDLVYILPNVYVLIYAQVVSSLWTSSHI